MKRSRKGEHGFTLIEILTALGIVALLSSVLFAVTVRGKRSAHEAAVMSNLRQIGLAAELYSEQSGARNLSMHKLYLSGVFPKELMSSKLDPTETGFANELLAVQPEFCKVRTEPVKVKSSILGFMEMCQADISFQQLEREYENLGWAFTPTSGDSVKQRDSYPYLRLLFDTSVQKRRTIKRTVTDERGVPTRGEVYLDYFGDKKE